MVTSRIQETFILLYLGDISTFTALNLSVLSVQVEDLKLSKYYLDV